MMYAYTMVSFVTQSGGTALLYAGWQGHSEVVKLLLGAGARDIPDKVDHRVTMMCRKSVLVNHRVYVDTSVCQTYSLKERELSRVGLEPTTLFSGYQQAVPNHNEDCPHMHI